jgi:class 3 adenylate cyclase
VSPTSLSSTPYLRLRRFAYAAVEDDFEAELRGEMNLKGIQASVQVYRVIGSRTGLGEP